LNNNGVFAIFRSESSNISLTCLLQAGSCIRGKQLKPNVR